MSTVDTEARGTEMPARGRRGFSWWSVLWLTLVWLLLWGDVDPVLVVGGALVSMLVLMAFPLPRVPITLRVRPWQTLVLAARFLYDLVVASVEVTWLAIRPGPVTRGVVLDLELAGDDELLQTITAEMVALVPGTVVIDLDSAERLITLHALDVKTVKEAQEVRHRVLAQEARVLRAFHPDPDSLLHPRRRRETQEQRDREREKRARIEEQDRLAETARLDDQARAEGQVRAEGRGEARASDDQTDPEVTP